MERGHHLPPLLPIPLPSPHPTPMSLLPSGLECSLLSNSIMEIRATDPQRARKPSGRSVHNTSPKIQGTWFKTCGMVILRSLDFLLGWPWLAFVFWRVFLFLFFASVVGWEMGEAGSFATSAMAILAEAWGDQPQHIRVCHESAALGKNNAWLHTCCLSQPTSCAEAHVLAKDFKFLAELRKT